MVEFVEVWRTNVWIDGKESRKMLRNSGDTKLTVFILLFFSFFCAFPVHVRHKTTRWPTSTGLRSSVCQSHQSKHPQPFTDRTLTVLLSTFLPQTIHLKITFRSLDHKDHQHRPHANSIPFAHTWVLVETENFDLPLQSQLRVSLIQHCQVGKGPPRVSRVPCNLHPKRLRSN